jgi:hypothetical protein
MGQNIYGAGRKITDAMTPLDESSFSFSTSEWNRNRKEKGK